MSDNIIDAQRCQMSFQYGWHCFIFYLNKNYKFRNLWPSCHDYWRISTNLSIFYWIRTIVVTFLTMIDSAANSCLQPFALLLSSLPFILWLYLWLRLVCRLMSREPYQRLSEGVTSYDGNYVVKLINCYRCHPAILRIPNQLFYDNDLIPAGN